MPLSGQNQFKYIPTLPLGLLWLRLSSYAGALHQAKDESAFHWGTADKTASWLWQEPEHSTSICLKCQIQRWVLKRNKGTVARGVHKGAAFLVMTLSFESASQHICIFMYFILSYLNELFRLHVVSETLDKYTRNINTGHLGVLMVRNKGKKMLRCSEPLLKKDEADSMRFWEKKLSLVTLVPNTPGKSDSLREGGRGQRVVNGWVMPC